SCSGTPFTVTVTVSPRPAINDYNISICTGSSFSITPSNGTDGIVPAGTTYSWTAPTVTGGISGGTSGGGLSNISGTLVNPTDSPQTATYTISAISGTCAGSTFTVIVTVDPITAITSHPSTALDIECFGDGFEPLTVTAVGGGLTYQWYRNTVASNVGGTAVTGANSASFTPPSTTQGSAWYYVVVTGNCGTETSDVSGQHLVTPPITTIAQHPDTTNQSACLGGSFPTPTLTVQALGEGTITYQWYRNTTNSNTGGTLIPGATSPSYTPPTDNVGTTYYYATGKSNCGTVPTDVSGAFTVTPLTTIDTENLASQTICFGSSFAPISIAATGTGTINYQWYSNTVADNSTGTPISGATSSSYTPPSGTAGTSYYYVVVSGDCGPDQTSSVSGPMTVNALPTPTFETAPTGQVCVGASVTYTTQSGQSNYVWSGFGTAGTDYTISGGGIGTTDHTVTVTWLTSGTKNISVRYTDTNNCAATVSATNSLVVNSLPTPTFTTVPTGPVCVGTSVTYTTQGSQSNYNWTVPGTAGTDYNITAGGIGSTNSTVTLTWLTSGSKTVTVGYTNSNNCTATTLASNTLTVNALPVPTFTTSPGPLVCLQQDVTYTTQTGKSNYVWSLPGTAGTDYTIVSGGTGSSSSSVTVRWLTTGSKTVTTRYREPSTGCTATANASSTTTVEPFATVGLPTASPAFPTPNYPTVCLNSPSLRPFVQATTGVSSIGTPTGLPAGVNATFNPSTNNIEFSGTVTAPAGLYSYSIPLNGNCINGLAATGTIHVVPTYEITAISSVSATTLGGNATVFFYGNSSTMINGTYDVSYEIQQANGGFTTHNTTATVTNGRGVFSTIPINSNTDTYTVRIISLKKSTDLCTTSFTDRPTTYFGVCSAVYGANSSFTVPANVYSITIEVYGGGGGGGSHGGGGGGYSIRQNIPVVPGEVLGVFVGTGGGNGVNGGTSYVTRDSNDPDILNTSLVYATGGNGGNGANSAGGTRDPRHGGSNGANANGTNGGNAGGPLGGAAGTDGVNGSSPGGGGGKKAGNRGIGGTGLVIISYSCPDADDTDCIKVIDDGSKSGTTVLEFTCDLTWTAPEGLAEFTVYVGSAGGGGGSGEGSGGGGSGALIRQTFTTSNPYGLPAGTSFTIGVGEGGPGAPTVDANGFPGEASTFSGTIDGSPINISVPGGGGGASRANNLGGTGASGGGGSATPAPTKSEDRGGTPINITYNGPNSTVYLGNPGGDGDYSDPQNSVAGGGGGGLTPWKPAPADDGQHGKAAGNGQGEGGRGGDGIVLTLGDSLRYFGAGGGGIGRFFNGTDKIGEGGSAGGVRIGGSGNLSGTNPIGGPGTNKTGSGGGAGYFGGGRGGDGIVYITFLNFRILEVEYLYFEASYLESDQKSLLKWATSKEWENSHFEIERSINGVANWQKIGTVKGQGYSNESVEYQFKDENLPASGGIIYYRLKQFDFDGKFAYSKVKSIQVEPISGNSYWVAYPNPSNRNEPVSLSLLNTSVYNDEPIVIRISDARGVTETYTVRSTEEVSEKVNYHLRDIDHGLFIIQLIWGNHQQQIKLIRK
uniref:glycine-rich domain-containing protein n=1 Tax=Algoriphagus algorifonticola TaxID=2593007 RepID=UPI002939290E